MVDKYQNMGEKNCFHLLTCKQTQYIPVNRRYKLPDYRRRNARGRNTNIPYTPVSHPMSIESILERAAVSASMRLEQLNGVNFETKVLDIL